MQLKVIAESKLQRKVNNAGDMVFEMRYFMQPAFYNRGWKFFPYKNHIHPYRCC